MHGEITDPCIVDGHGLSRLVPLLSNAFSEIELEELIRFTFSEGLFEEYVPHGLNLRDLAFRLMEALTRRGTTDIFLRAVLTARPRRRDLADLILLLCPSAGQPEPEAKTQVEVVLSGLAALGEAATALDTVDKLKPLLPKFGSLVDGFTRMSQLLQLIDHLTRIQHWSQLSESSAHRFIDNDLSQAYLREVETALKLLRDNSTELSSEFSWIDRTILEVGAAIETNYAAEQNRAARSVRSIARLELRRHAVLLQQIAEDLPLDDLIQVVADVREYVGLDSISSAAISLSLGALQHLYPRVRGLATRQTRWRLIEDDLLLMDELGAEPTDRSRRDLIGGLIVLVSDVEKFVQMDPEGARFTSIRNYVAKKGSLITLLEENDHEAFRKANDRFRHEVRVESWRDYKALQSLCRDILEILQPLKSLVEVLSR